ncbi:MAG: site-specific DNA-methyltransferase [Symploca sp. SIO2D2]|nr:site-specific DNA-methyltransferase [Symploca sp. SIO2D2]
MPEPYTRTKLGQLYLGKSEEFLKGDLGNSLEGKVQLIFTSPPFPLNQKKRYGNLKGEDYLKWFTELAPVFSRLLKPDGSIVIELGNAWESERPVQSLLPLRALLDFVSHEDAGLRLCQQFICHNPARLPSPVQWVNVKRCRVTDSYTQLWWMATSDYPKADNRKVLRPYSKKMQKLLERGTYNAGKRPSGHDIGKRSFCKDNGGSISQNVLEIEPIIPGEEIRLPRSAFSISNTTSSDYFHTECKHRGIKPHPARMEPRLADFFIQFLTEPGDLVLDPFAGSNVTGYVAECTGRKWVSIEAEQEYAAQSCIRLENLEPNQVKDSDLSDSI